MVQDISTIVSILPMRFISDQKPGVTPSYVNLPACDKGKMVLRHITEGNVPIPQLEGKTIDQRLQSFKLAHAICDDYWRHMPGTTDDAHPGIMALPGKLTEKDVLTFFQPQYEALVKVQEKWLESLIDQADDSWIKYRAHLMITDHHRMAAEYFGLKKEWQRPDLSPRVEMNLCVACYSPIHPMATVCPTCRSSQKADPDAIISK